MSAEFNLPEVEAGIAATRFRGELIHLRSTDSTNRLAVEAAREGRRGGVWVAEEQTAGRGRGGHRWHSSASEGLYVSALVTPRLPLSGAGRLPLAAGLAARAAVLEIAGLTPDLRWPNDLMFGDRKLGGILVESASASAAEEGRELSLRYAIVGIGINVNHASFPEDLRAIATSLRLEGGRDVAREALLASLLRHLDHELDLIDEAELGGRSEVDLLHRFARASSWVRGKDVTVDEAGGYSGLTRGLDARGFLLVEDRSGRLRTVLSGGVRSA